MTNYFNRLLFISIFVAIAVLSLSNIAADQSINIISPSNNSKFSTSVIPINYGVITDNPTDICWYTLGTAPGVIISCFNNTFNIGLASGNNLLTLYINRFNITNYNSAILALDNTAPIITITNPTTNGYYGNTSLGLNNLTFNISDSNCASYWIFNGTNNITNPSPCINTTFYNIYTPIGTNTWTIYANDTYNNLASSSVSFTYDPVYPILNSLNLNMHEDYIEMDYKSNENIMVSIRYGSNLSAGLNLTENTTGYDDEDTIELEDLVNGTIYYYNITIMDRALNRVTYGPFNFTFNSTETISPASCYTEAICSEWGSCSAVGLQTRSCNKILINCSYSVSPVLTRTCNYSIQTATPGPLTTVAPAQNDTSTTTSKGLSDGWKITLIIGGVILIIVMGVLIYLRYKNPISDEIKELPYDQTYDPTQDPKYSRGTSYSDDPDDYLGDNI